MPRRANSTTTVRGSSTATIFEHNGKKCIGTFGKERPVEIKTLEKSLAQDGSAYATKAKTDKTNRPIRLFPVYVGDTIQWISVFPKSCC